MRISLLDVGTIVLLAGLGGPAALAADCATDPKNLFATRNCGFAKGIDGWTGVHDKAASYESSDGDPAKGALAGNDHQGSLQLQAPCITVQPDTAYRISFRLRVVSGSLYVCGYPTFEADDAASESASDPLTADARPPAETWQPMTGETRTGASAKSVQLWLNCSGEKGFRVLFDDIEFAAK